MKSSRNLGNVVLSVFFIVSVISVISSRHASAVANVLHNVVKRMEIETCLDRFDVHRDMIIRTEESRSMGAKFLDYADLGSREDCLRLCCETDGCDVFVLEEKSQGTCFLFQCGPPENFRCKFTRHGNYTSAVLTQQQQSAPPPPQSAQAQPQPPPPPPPPPAPVTPNPIVNSLLKHEMELASLRVDSPYRGDAVQMATTTTARPLLPTTKETKALAEKQAPTSHCGRFQFQCHSGECIAVYNACNGIPQCEDGSDEGPECPAATTKFPVKPVLAKLPGQDLGPPRDMISQNMGMADSQKAKNPPVVQRPYLQPQQQLQHPQIDSIQLQQQQPVPVIHNREDPMSAPPKMQWSAHQTGNDAASAYNMLDSSSSHIFNHKGGLQLPANNVVPQYENSFNSPAANAYPMQMDNQEQYRNQIPPQQQQQPLQQQWMNDRHYGSPPQMQQQTQLGGANWPSQLARQDVEQQQLNSLQGQQQTQGKDDWPLHSNPVAQGGNDIPEPINSKFAKAGKNLAGKSRKKAQPQSNDEDEDDYDDQTEEEEKPTEAPPPKKQRKHKKQQKAKESNDGTVESTKIIKNKAKDSDKPLREQLRMLKSDLEIEFADHDGASERPSGAVLSLTLGVLIAAALAVLIGCRMRAVGRRVRRHGKNAYAHDADFLVNGMYL